MGTGPSRKRWTRAECASLEASGLLDQQHLELVEAWLQTVFWCEACNPGAPIDVSPDDNASNEPEPEIIVLNRDLSHFCSINPGPHDLNLVVEVADTTLHFDLTIKAALYARAGIADYWVLDASGRRVIVHRQPLAGKYTVILVYSEQEAVSPLAAPHAMFKAANAFPD